MNILSRTIACLVIGFIFVSCGGDGDGTMSPEKGGLSITINSPEDNSTFSIGDTIVVSYTVMDDEEITTIAWDTNSDFGTGSVPGTEFLDVVTEYSGEFRIPAEVDIPGTYQIDLSATDAGFENVVEATLNVILE